MSTVLTQEEKSKGRRIIKLMPQTLPDMLNIEANCMLEHWTKNYRELTSYPKISEFGMTLRVEKNISGLDITMNRLPQV